MTTQAEPDPPFTPAQCEWLREHLAVGDARPPTGTITEAATDAREDSSAIQEPQTHATALTGEWERASS